MNDSVKLFIRTIVRYQTIIIMSCLLCLVLAENIYVTYYLYYSYCIKLNDIGYVTSEASSILINIKIKKFELVLKQYFFLSILNFLEINYKRTIYL